MSTEAPVQPPAPAKEAPSPNAPSPEVQERLVFGPIMLLIIVPLYVLIALTLKVDLRYTIVRVAHILFIDDLSGVWQALHVAYHATVIGLCALAPNYALLNAIRLSRRGVRPGYLVTAWCCVGLAGAEAAALLLAVYRYRVAV
jgi:hypothetical protein